VTLAHPVNVTHNNAALTNLTNWNVHNTGRADRRRTLEWHGDEPPKSLIGMQSSSAEGARSRGASGPTIVARVRDIEADARTFMRLTFTEKLKPWMEDRAGALAPGSAPTTVLAPTVLRVFGPLADHLQLERCCVAPVRISLGHGPSPVEGPTGVSKRPGHLVQPEGFTPASGCLCSSPSVNFEAARSRLWMTLVGRNPLLTLPPPHHPQPINKCRIVSSAALD
jgi:hypothetical protein